MSRLQAVSEMRTAVGLGEAPPRALSDAIDALFQELLGGTGVTVLALGGYGRAEVAPYSDIDLQVLTEGGEQVLGPVLEPLWRLGWKVGFATRTADETIALAQTDLRTAMALLEARCVSGPAEPWRAVDARLWSDVFVPQAVSLVAQLRSDRQLRHARPTEGLHALEPDLKGGAGGLRDAHAARWIARLLGHHADSHQPPLAGFGLTPHEAERLEQAGQELLRIRCALHGVAGRRGDRLHLALHDAVAARLGLGSAATLLQRFGSAAARVEAFSRRVLHHAQVLQGVEVGPWCSWGAEQALLDDDTLDPVRLFAPFVAAAESGVPLHPRDVTRVAAALPAVGEGTRRDPVACGEFFALLTHPDDGHALLQAHAVGAVTAFVPEFRALAGRYQRNALHSYTVDVHSLHAVSVLKRALAQPETPEGAVLAGLEPLERNTLALATLLHDLDKGGCEPALAYMVAERLGLPPDACALVVELVRSHLTLALLSQTRDVADPSTLRLVAREVGDRRTLRLLYLLTHADMASTRPEFYTAWKRGLLHDLYRRSDQLLGEGMGLFADDTHVARQRRHAVLQRLGLHAGLPDGTTRAVDAFLSSLPTRYFAVTPAETTERHWEMRQRGSPVWRREGEAGLVVWSVVAKEAPGQLPRLAGVLAARGLSIVRANAFRGSDGWAVVELVVASPDERWPDLQRLDESLAAAAAGQGDPEHALRQRERPSPLARPLPAVAAEVSYDLWSSDCYTIFDVVAQDRAGLFYRTSRALQELGVDVELARVGTDGPVARIGFHVHRKGDKLSLDDAHAAWRVLSDAAG